MNVDLSNGSWSLGKLPSCVETYIPAVNRDIKSSKSKNLPRDNLTKSEIEFIYLFYVDKYKKYTS